MKIAIVNDMPATVEAMQRILIASGRYQVAWSASAGADAVALCQSDPPDLLLMDLTTRGMDGVEAIRRIMAAAPCAILIVTEAVGVNSAKVFDAMGAGALDVVQTPCMDRAEGANGVAAFIGKIDSVASLIGRAAAKPATAKPAQCAKQLLAIGSSAGGPAALASLLRELPADFPAAVIVVQHIDAQFAPGLAKWLGEQSRLPVRPATAGDMPVAGTVLLAATNDHLILESSTRLGYTRHPLEYSYRPSVNAFFESTARHWRGPMIGVLLTGMGCDGAKGLKMLRNLGHHTIAQDQSTSAVYGMPRAAAELQAATEILPLERIASAVGHRFRSGNHINPTQGPQ
jgi:two-component system response regulator WspF